MRLNDKKSDSPLYLSNQLCFPIYVLSKKITNYYRPLLKELDLTYPQYLVMLVLWEHETQTVGSLCTKLHLDTGTLTPLLKRLELKKYITRQRNPEDERVVMIALTVDGINLAKRAELIPMSMYDAITKEYVINDKEFELLQLVAKKFCLDN